MPHIRERHLKILIKKTLKFSPIVGLFGHRQVGKTTLATQLTKKYTTLDKRAMLDQAVENPESFIIENHSNPLVVDECQYAPPLFPALKEWVRTHPQPGQFLLTGSVRFSSRKMIRESLTGRMIAWELLPMDLSETYEAPLPISLIQLLKSKTVEVSLKDSAYTTPAHIEKYLDQGGLPGLFSIRETNIRKQKFETQISTLLDRDLRLVLETSLSIRRLESVLRVLSLQQGQPLELVKLSRATRISTPTLRKLISAFESIFLIRLIPSEGSSQKPILFFEDQGEASYLSQNRYDELTQLTRLLFANLHPQIKYRPEENITIFQYRTRGGACVPLCFRTKNHVLGVMPIFEEVPNRAELASARSFLSFYQKINSKIIFVTRGRHEEVLSSHMRIIRMGQLI